MTRHHGGIQMHQVKTPGFPGLLHSHDVLAGPRTFPLDFYFLIILFFYRINRRVRGRARTFRGGDETRKSPECEPDPGKILLITCPTSHNQHPGKYIRVLEKTSRNSCDMNPNREKYFLQIRPTCCAFPHTWKIPK